MLFMNGYLMRNLNKQMGYYRYYFQFITIVFLGILLFLIFSVIYEKKFTTLQSIEIITIVGKTGKEMNVEALIDSGADSTSLDKELAAQLGFTASDAVRTTTILSSQSTEEKRDVINITYFLKDKQITTQANIADRSKLPQKIIIGKNDLKGFLIEI